MPNYLDTVASFVADTTYADLPSAAVERARRVIADSVAAIVAGAAEPEVIAFTRRLVPEPGGTASVIGAGIRTEPAKAALLNGTRLLYTSPSPRDRQKSRMPSSA